MAREEGWCDFQTLGESCQLLSSKKTEQPQTTKHQTQTNQPTKPQKHNQQKKTDRVVFFLVSQYHITYLGKAGLQCSKPHTNSPSPSVLYGFLYVFIWETLTWNISMAYFLMHNLERLGSMNLWKWNYQINLHEFLNFWVS